MNGRSIVTVIGLGYIGLPTATILAANGHQVLGVDVDENVVEAVNRGQVPFVEPGMDVALASAVEDGNLVASVLVSRSDAFIIAVPTPFKEGHLPDMTYIDAAIHAVSIVLTGKELIVLESTSPPGTTSHIAKLVARLRPDLLIEDGLTDRSGGIQFAHCPERVLPGQIMLELVENDRIVGGLTQSASLAAASLYESFCHGRIFTTSAMVAETAKLAENAFRDVNIAFANELAALSESIGIDGREVISLANRHPRVNILQPGPGVGGHCIAVDPWFLIAAAPDSSALMYAARTVNDARPMKVADDVQGRIDGRNFSSVTLFGLAYKPDIDDLRESPSVLIAENLARRNPAVTFNVVEPHIGHLPSSLVQLANVRLVSFETAIRTASLAVLLVAHSVFRNLRRDEIAAEEIIDICGIFSPQYN